MRDGAVNPWPSVPASSANERHTAQQSWQQDSTCDSYATATPVAATTTNNTRKTKRSSYHVQREEREELVRQAQELELEIEALRLRAGLRTKRYHDDVDACRAQNRDLEDHVNANDRMLARLQSLLTSELLVPPFNPMASFIHLPKDMDERRSVLRSMQARKLQRGIDTVIERLRDFDPLLPSKTEEWLTTESGECHFYRTDVNQFTNYKTARQLYDTFVQFLYNQEINLTEMLGHLTLREDTDEIAEATMWNHRFVTYTEKDISTELNLVGFAQFYDHAAVTGSPMGIIICDTVNIDDLYPYVPDERACKDAQTANLVYEVKRPDSDDVVVVFKQVSFIVQLRPQFPFEPAAWDRLLANIPRWPNAIHKYLRAYVVPD